MVEPEKITIVGKPISSFAELAGIINRIQSGQSTLEEECARNLEGSSMKFALKFTIPEVKDAYSHEVAVTVDGQEASKIKKIYPGKAKETDEMEFTAGNTVTRTITSTDKEGKVIGTPSTFTYTVTDDELPKELASKKLVEPKSLEAKSEMKLSQEVKSK